MCSMRHVARLMRAVTNTMSSSGLNIFLVLFVTKQAACQWNLSSFEVSSFK